MPIKNNDNMINIFSFFVFLVMVLFFSPVYFHKFAYHNDYRIWDSNNYQQFFRYPETVHLFAVGRPILAVLLNLQLMIIGNMKSLQMMHGIAVLLICTAASLYYLYLYKMFCINRFSAALLSVLTFTLPSMSINSFWVTNLTSEILPIFLILYAHYLVSRIDSYKRTKFTLIAVFFILFVCLLIYPPVTMFFVTLTFIKFLFGAKELIKNKLNVICYEVLMILLSCITYFLFFKCLYKPLLLKSHFSGFDFQYYFKFIELKYSEYKFSIFSDSAQKVKQLYDLITLVVSAWFPPLNRLLTGIFVTMLFILLIIATITNRYLIKLQAFKRAICGFFIAMMLIALTALPVLAGSGRFEISYRVIFPTMAIIPAVLVYTFDRYYYAQGNIFRRRVVLSVMLLFILCAVTLSFYRLMLVIKRASTEYSNVLNAVTHDVFYRSKEIRIPFTPPVHSKLESKFLDRDFGLISMGVTTAGIINAASQEIGRNLTDYKVITNVLGPRYDANISEGIIFKRYGEPRFIRRYNGISGKEKFGRWTDGENVSIEFMHVLPKIFTLKIYAGTFPQLINKSVKIMIGNTQLVVRFASQKESVYSFNVSTDGNAKSIIFKFPNIKSPKELGLSDDNRHLGLALSKIEFIY